MKKLLVMFCLAILCAAPLLAHPHVSFDVHLEFEFAADRCSGFWEEWTFDPIFSAQLINDFDSDRNGRFNGNEMTVIEGGAFSNLRKYGYFTLIRQADNRWSPAKVDRFVPAVRDGRVIYRFYVSLAERAYNNDFYVAIFDTTYYCAVRYVNEAVLMSDTAPTVISWAREVNKKFPVYYDPAGAATDGTVYGAWRPGLQTAFPEEIHIIFGD